MDMCFQLREHLHCQLQLSPKNERLSRVLYSCILLADGFSNSQLLQAYLRLLIMVISIQKKIRLFS